MYKYPVFLRYPALIMALVMVFISGIVQAAKIWYPVEVDVWEPVLVHRIFRSTVQTLTL